MRGFIGEILGLYNAWGGLVFSIQFLAFVAQFNSGYVPTASNDRSNHH